MNTLNINRNRYIKSLKSLIVNDKLVPTEFDYYLDADNPQIDDHLLYNGTKFINSDSLNKLSNYSNVDLTGIQEGDQLVYTGTGFICDKVMTLGALDDVTFTNLQNNDTIMYNSTGNIWENKSLAFSNLNDVNLTNIQNNNILKYSNNQYINSDLQVNELTNYITLSPSVPKSIVIGSNNITSLNNTDSIIIGNNTQVDNIESGCIAIGNSCTINNRKTETIVIGNNNDHVIGEGSIVINTKTIPTGTQTHGIECVHVAVNSVANNAGVNDYKVSCGSNVNISTGCNSVAIGSSIFTNSACNVDFSVGIGDLAGTNSSNYCVCIGTRAGQFCANNFINIGGRSGVIGGQFSVLVNRIDDTSSCTGSNAVSIGYFVTGANYTTHKCHHSVSIGSNTGRTSQAESNVSIGVSANMVGKSNNTISIGFNAGSNNQGTRSIAIGSNAGSNNQGSNSIAIGYNCSSTANNSIVLNASTTIVNKTTKGLFVGPGTIRSTVIAGASGRMYYDPVTGEITYSV